MQRPTTASQVLSSLSLSTKKYSFKNMIEKYNRRVATSQHITVVSTSLPSSNQGYWFVFIKLKLLLWLYQTFCLVFWSNRKGSRFRFLVKPSYSLCGLLSAKTKPQSLRAPYFWLQINRCQIRMISFASVRSKYYRIIRLTPGERKSLLGIRLVIY